MTNPHDHRDGDPTDWSAPGGSWGTPASGGYHAAPERADTGQQAGDQPPPPGQYDPSPQYGGPGGYGDYIPAQPGIIPLQPLTLGQIYDGAFKAIRSNPIVMFVFAGVVVSVIAIIETVLSASFFQEYFSALDALSEDPEALEAFSEDDLLRMFSGALAPMLLGSALSFVATTILTGILTLAVSQAVLGFKPSLGQVWDQAKGQLPRLVVLVLLIGIITLSVPAILTGLTILALVSGAIGLGVVAGLVTVFGSIAWTLYIVTLTALATPALMLERSGILTGLRRGWRLAKTQFWRVLGIYLLTMIIVAAVSVIISMPLSMITMFLPPTAILIAQGVTSALAGALITPFSAAVMALLYIDIRIRREGLAAELAAAAQ